MADFDFVQFQICVYELELFVREDLLSLYIFFFLYIYIYIYLCVKFILTRVLHGQLNKTFTDTNLEIYILVQIDLFENSYGMGKLDAI